MNPVHHIELPDDFPVKPLRHLFGVLGAGDDEGAKGGAKDPQVLIVGGAVRNLLLGVPVKDVDVATVFTPEIVMEKLESAGVKVIPTGVAHGTVTAVIECISIEITTLRIDIECDGRHATVAFGQDWREDAKRRDFTMNALYMDLDGGVYDPLGTGLSAAQQAHVCFIGDAGQRIREDALRILRFFRFYAAYDAGEPDDAAMQACARHVTLLDGLSKERITEEFFKILQARRGVDAIELMFENNVLSTVSDLFDGALLSHLDRLVLRQNTYGTFHDAARFFVLLREDVLFAALQSDFVLPLRTIRFFDDMRACAAAAPQTDAGWHKVHIEPYIRRMLYFYGRDVTLQTCLLQCPPDDLEACVAMIKAADIPVFPVSGRDVIAQGIDPGPLLGALLGQVEAWWTDGGCVADREACLARLADLIDADDEGR